MRNLTPKEIDAAPVWAVSYFVEQLEGNKSRAIFHERHYAFTLPLPARKPFDVEPYKHWCDPVNDNNGPPDYCYYAEIQREKAIEIAKHFKLTGEDLR